MGLTKRLSTILKAKASKALDKAEDPRETLDYSYQRMLEQLTQVRRGVADVATSRKRLELQAAQLTQSGAKLEEQARQAIAQNREDLAREALSRRASIVQQLQDLKTQQDELDRGLLTVGVDAELERMKAELGQGSAPKTISPPQDTKSLGAAPVDAAPEEAK